MNHKIFYILFLSIFLNKPAEANNLYTCISALYGNSYHPKIILLHDEVFVLPSSDNKSFSIFTKTGSATCDLPEKPSEVDQMHKIYYLKISLLGNLQYLTYKQSDYAVKNPVEFHNSGTPAEIHSAANILPDSLKNLINKSIYKTPICNSPASSVSELEMKVEITAALASVSDNFKQDEVRHKSLVNTLSLIKKGYYKITGNSEKFKAPTPEELTLSKKGHLRALENCEKINDDNFNRIISAQRLILLKNQASDSSNDHQHRVERQK